MARLDILTFLIVILSLGWKQYCPSNDKSEKLFKGLQRFVPTAGNQWSKKPIPDLRKWKSQRIMTINTLNDLQQKRDNICYKTKRIKSVVSGMSKICSLLNSAGILDANSSKNSLAPLIKTVGGVICKTAHFAEKALPLMETELFTAYQNELQAVLKNDKEISQSLEELLNFSPNLEKEFQRIFGFDLKSENSKYFILLYEFSRLYDHFQNFKDAYDTIKRGKHAEFIDKDRTIRNLCLKFSTYLQQFPRVSEKINLSLSALNILIQIRSLDEAQQYLMKGKMVTTISLLGDKLNIKMPYSSKAYVFSLINVLDLTTKAVSFGEDIKINKDCKCPYSDSLKHIIDMLKLELAVIECFLFYIK